MKANESGNLSIVAFPLIDEPDKVFFHFFEGAILDIPRYRGREFVHLSLIHLRKKYMSYKAHLHVLMKIRTITFGLHC